MISSSLKPKIDKYFPEMGFTVFKNRFDVPDVEISSLDLSMMEFLNRRIANICSDLAVEMAAEESEASRKEAAVEKKTNEIIYMVGLKTGFTYNDISSISENKSTVSNEAARKAFASFVVSQMIINGDLDDPQPSRARANILKSVWYSLQEVGDRIDSFGISESTRIKHASRMN